jgi:thiol-disulfide isomerase/thioredoxin
VFFFTSWSVPSRKFVPELNSLARQHADKLVVVGITTETDSASASLEPRIEFPIATDAQGRFTSAAGITSVPQALLVDHKGIVHYQGHPAGLTERKLNSLLAKAAE